MTKLEIHDAEMEKRAAEQAAVAAAEQRVQEALKRRRFAA